MVPDRAELEPRRARPRVRRRLGARARVRRRLGARARPRVLPGARRCTSPPRSARRGCAGAACSGRSRRCARMARPIPAICELLAGALRGEPAAAGCTTDVADGLSLFAREVTASRANTMALTAMALNTVAAGARSLDDPLDDRRRGAARHRPGARARPARWFADGARSRTPRRTRSRRAPRRAPPPRVAHRTRRVLLLEARTRGHTDRRSGGRARQRPDNSSDLIIGSSNPTDFRSDNSSGSDLRSSRPTAQ